jgi:hypothetical protein
MSSLDRRALIKQAMIGSLAGGAIAATDAQGRTRRAKPGPPAPAPAPNAFGVGTYTDASVADQISNFTINRLQVSCGVGTVAASGWTGPFAMLMYSTHIAMFEADALASYLRASGRMRSITQMLGKTIEDVEHDFVAVAHGHNGSGPPRFDVHFATPFWKPGNPMATRSTDYPGKCRFGGEMLLGEITIGR